jgi:hypothetical protein
MLSPPLIPEEEQTPTVRSLLAIIEQLQQDFQQQQERIVALEAEIARLKKLPKKPKIRPNTLPKDDDDDEPGIPGKGEITQPGKPPNRVSAKRS